ncbi:hypothetical protein GCM10009546_25690 [Actinomadura livida]|uniref:Uncharacterized protein n=1 Tax=Actinomadura livida TaxID=79909 RepID=A0ABN1EA69_9ACTN|nr:hypothetical protein GCM10010208_38170 [Actinomadura livida]
MGPHRPRRGRTQSGLARTAAGGRRFEAIEAAERKKSHVLATGTSGPLGEGTASGGAWPAVVSLPVGAPRTVGVMRRQIQEMPRMVVSPSGCAGAAETRAPMRGVRTVTRMCVPERTCFTPLPHTLQLSCYTR